MTKELAGSRRLFRTLTCASVLAFSAPAWAESPPHASAAAAKDPQPPLAQALSGEARADYESALLLYQDGDFSGASLKFQRAYAASHDARLLWNAGAAEKSLRHYGKTYLLVSQYLREASDHLTQPEKDEATALLRTIESFVSHVTASAEPEGTQLSVDDTPVATLPTTDPIVVDMGTRRFRFTKDGFHEAVVIREVAGGSPTTLDARLEVDKKEGTLRITADSGNTIRIDGKVLGSGQWQGPLIAGVHSVGVDGTDRKPYHTEVAIEAGRLTTLRVGLEPLEHGEKSKFLAWPWVAGGIAVVALVGVGAYVAFSPEKSPPSQPAVGTVAPGYWTLHY